MPERFERLMRPAAAEGEERRRIHLPSRSFVTFIAVILIAVWLGVRVYDLIAAPEVTVIGESMQAGAFTYEVTKVETSKVIGSGLLAESAEGVYKTVSVAVLNSDDVSHGIDQNAFTIIDAEGVEYFPVCRTDLGDCVNVPDTFTLSLLPAGVETIGVFTYDVDPRATGFRLRVIIEPVSGKSIYFKLD